MKRKQIGVAPQAVVGQMKNTLPLEDFSTPIHACPPPFKIIHLVENKEAVSTQHSAFSRSKTAPSLTPPNARVRLKVEP